MDRIGTIRHTTISDTLHTFFFIHQSKLLQRFLFIKSTKNTKCEEAKKKGGKHTLGQPDIHRGGVSLCTKVVKGLAWAGLQDDSAASAKCGIRRTMGAGDFTPVSCHGHAELSSCDGSMKNLGICTQPQ